MARRSEHSQAEIKAMILDAAETIIAEDGLKALTVRRIAMDIGYTVGTIYMVFANLDELRLHVKGRVLDALSAHLQTARQTHDDPAAAIMASAKAYLSFASQHYHHWSLLFEPHMADDTALPDWYQHKIEQLFIHIEALFKQLTPAASDAQIKQAARALWSGVHGVCVLSLNGSLDVVGVDMIEQTLQLLVEDFLYGWQHRQQDGHAL